MKSTVSMLGFALFASMVGLAGCSAATDSEAARDTATADEGAADTATSDDALVASEPTHVVVTRDTRKCAAPACGGYFVARVNRPTTRCPDGRSRATCYVATIDLTMTELGTPDEANALVHPAGLGVEVLFTGDFVPSGRFGSFVASRAWRAPAPVELTDDVFNVSRHGLPCETEGPCAPVRATRLNSVAAGRILADVAFEGAPRADKCGLRATIADATYAVANADVGQSFGLLVAGRRDRRGVLRASQYFVWQPGPCNQGIRGRGL